MTNVFPVAARSGSVLARIIHRVIAALGRIPDWFIALAARFSALALLCMTVVIEIFVYPGAWPTHGVWATCLLIVIARGPGWLSLDHLIARKYQ
jgi:hypothetical protein